MSKSLIMGTKEDVSKRKAKLSNKVVDEPVRKIVTFNHPSIK